MTNIRSAYSERHIVSIDEFDEGQTKQSHAKECDINVIMAKYQKSGVINHVKEYGASYEDYDAMEYHDAMNIIAEGDSMFADLPSKARAEFDNDPAKFMESVNSPEGVEKLRKLGLIYGDYATTQPVPNDEDSNTNNNEGSSDSE